MNFWIYFVKLEWHFYSKKAPFLVPITHQKQGLYFGLMTFATQNKHLWANIFNQEIFPTRGWSSKNRGLKMLFSPIKTAHKSSKGTRKSFQIGWSWGGRRGGVDWQLDSETLGSMQLIQFTTDDGMANIIYFVIVTPVVKPFGYDLASGFFENDIQ